MVPAEPRVQAAAVNLLQPEIVQHPEHLQEFAQMLIDCSYSRACTTNKQQSGDIRRFQTWCDTKKFCSLPASPAVAAMYLNHVRLQSAAKGVGPQTVEQATSAAITAMHAQACWLALTGSQCLVR